MKSNFERFLCRCRLQAHQSALSYQLRHGFVNKVRSIIKLDSELGCAYCAWVRVDPIGERKDVRIESLLKKSSCKLPGSWQRPDHPAQNKALYCSRVISTLPRILQRISFGRLGVLEEDIVLSECCNEISGQSRSVYYDRACEDRADLPYLRVE